MTQASVNMTERDIYTAIVADFEGAWAALAASEGPAFVGRGNFMFARQAMVLLEWASRLTCPGGTPNAQHEAMSVALHAIEPRYFGLLPGSVGTAEEFMLPFRGAHPERQLLWGIFDLVRNGGAHQYQQIHAELTDERPFCISVSNGAWVGNFLGDPRRQPSHLRFSDQSNGLWLLVSPDTLFLDFKEAIERAGIPDSALRFEFLRRGRGAVRKKNLWQFDSARALEALRANGQIGT